MFTNLYFFLQTNYIIIVTFKLREVVVLAGMAKKRNYSEAFLAYGFVNLPDKGQDRPQCVICNKVLTNESLKPSKLEAHLKKCHPTLQEQDRAFFERRAKQLKGIQFGAQGKSGQQILAGVEASYIVAYKVAKQQKSHTIAEKLVLPCAKAMVAKVCGEDQAKKLNAVSLSNNTIRRRVDHMAEDILAQVIEEVKSSPVKFCLQFDESTDISSCAVPLGFIRYVYMIKEEFLLCENLTTTTKGEDVFNTVSRFLERNGLDWRRVQQVSIDGAPAMMGGQRGFRGFVKRENRSIEVDHCAIHRYSLGSKTLPASLKAVFNDVVRIVNFIKAKDLNSRVFKELCKEMGESYEVLLYHTEVRWLSRGRVVSRVVELREAIQCFLVEKNSDLAAHFSDTAWLFRLCYLADIFGELNKGNLALQGKNTTILDARESVSSFIKKLKLWSRRISRGVVAQFSTLDQFIDDNEEGQQYLDASKHEIQEHLDELVNNLERYFPNRETTSLQWCIQPFSADEDQVADDDFPAKEEWIALRVNQKKKAEFQHTDLQAFWIAQLSDAPTLAERALNIFTSFSTTYLCEKGFSTVMGLKTKKRNTLSLENDARIALSVTEPRITALAAQMQPHPSHGKPFSLE